MTKKERKKQYSEIIISYIGDPDNSFPTRTEIATKALELNDLPVLYKTFTPAELLDLERKGLDLRRSRYSRMLSNVDRAMISKAMTGDAQAARLCYQRFEGWSEKIALEANLFNGGDSNLSHDERAKLARARMIEELEGKAVDNEKKQAKGIMGSVRTSA